MIYKLFWFWANIAIRVFYGKIEVHGIEHIPRSGPLLIASNHPNGFLEPIIQACLFPRPLHFMVRGDVFRKAWLRPILVHTNQIPIFRFKDGFSALRQNDANLKEAYKALERNAAIILFVEGGTEPVKTLRPFQKGMARMAAAFLTGHKTVTSLPVLPVAINFVSPFSLRSRVVLNVGPTIEATQYFASDQNTMSGIRALTDDTYKAILPLAFHVKAKERQETLDHTLRLVEGLFPQPFWPMVDCDRKLWPPLKSVSDRINDMSDEDFLAFSNEANGIRQTDPDQVLRSGKSPILSGLLAVLLFVPGVIGLVLNLPPALIAQGLPRKVLKPTNTVFRASIMLSAGVGFFVVYYALSILILCIIFGWKGLLFFVAWPLGFAYLWWKNNYRSSFARSKYHLSEAQKVAVVALMEKYNISTKELPS